jgi:hypothetical protein
LLLLLVLPLLLPIGAWDCPVLVVCKHVLPGPAAAARAAAAASNKQRAAAEAAIAAAVSDVLHLLGALKSWVTLMAGEQTDLA